MKLTISLDVELDACLVELEGKRIGKSLDAAAVAICSDLENRVVDASRCRYGVVKVESRTVRGGQVVSFQPTASRNVMRHALRHGDGQHRNESTEPARGRGIKVLESASWGPLRGQTHRAAKLAGGGCSRGTPLGTSGREGARFGEISRTHAGRHRLVMATLA